MSKLDERFIVNLKDKDFVTYEGLLDLAHQEGLISIDVELLQIPSKDNGDIAIVRAVAKTKDRTFVDIGDAGPNSVNSMIKPHIIRMASTRAKARALRDLTNIGMTAIEEIIDEEKPKQNKRSDNNKSDKKDNLATQSQLNLMYKLVKEKNYGNDSISSYIKNAYNKDSSTELTKKEASEIIKMLNELGG